MTKHSVASRLAIAFFLSTLTSEAQYVTREASGVTETKGFAWEKLTSTRNTVSLPLSIQSSGKILHYQLDLNFTESLTNNNHFFSGREGITWKPNGDSLIVLDAVQLRIDSVVSETQRFTFDAQSVSNKLRITLNPSLRNRDSLLVNIWYAHASAQNLGYYYYDRDFSGTLERLGYTFTEPYDSPNWFLCINDPSIKVPCKIGVTVPTGYLAASNGLLKQTTNNGNGTVTFQWEERHPIAMYLMAVTISKYSTFSHYYRRVSNPSDSVEIKYYVWQADSAGPSYNAAIAFRNVLDMMIFYSRIFGEYPFDKYGMAAVFPFGAGGMEHQTMTTIHRIWLANGGSQGGIAHELAHQWWGDMVTCATWKDIWLNEGFATYSEALWEEHFFGKQTFRNLMQQIQHFSDPSWQFAIYDPPPTFLFRDLEYSKGAWVLHMLRYVLGDSAFLNVFKTYRQRFEYKSATTDDFAAAASTVAGRDMSWFFNQWVFGKGWPVYAYTWNAQPLVGGGSKVTVVIQQEQAEAEFLMPVQLTARSGSNDFTVLVNNTQRTQTFQFDVPFRPDTVIFDRDGWILKQMSPKRVTFVDGETSVPKEFVLYQNYPNPFNPGTLIRYDAPVDGVVSLKVYNLLGQEVRTLVNEQQTAGHHEVAFDGKSLTSGVYFYRLTVVPSDGRQASFVDTKKMVLTK